MFNNHSLYYFIHTNLFPHVKVQSAIIASSGITIFNLYNVSYLAPVQYFILPIFSYSLFAASLSIVRVTCASDWLANVTLLLHAHVSWDYSFCISIHLDAWSGLF